MGSILLVIFACYLPVKVTNMVLGGGILRSGGNTKLILFVDLIGTWAVGVPVGLLLPAHNMNGIDVHQYDIELVPVRRVAEAVRELFG